jgi:hypothetical protein
MKKLLTAILLLSVITPMAHAEEVGGWVIVDADGKQVSGVMVCTASVCGDPNSAVSKDLVKPGQRFVQQTLASPTGNVAGIPANETTKITVSPTNVFTVQTVTVKEPVLVETSVTPKESVTIKPIKTITEEQTVEPTPVSPVIPTVKTEIVSTVTTQFTLADTDNGTIKGTVQEESAYTFTEWFNDWSLWLDADWLWLIDVLQNYDWVTWAETL